MKTISELGSKSEPFSLIKKLEALIDRVTDPVYM